MGSMIQKRRDSSLPFVSVVIPHYDDLQALANCVDLVEKQDYPRELFEIIVADNNSRCGLPAVQSAVPTAMVVPAPIQGAGPARNVGVSVSSGDVLGFIDSDCAPERDWISRAVESLDAFDFIGGNVVTTCSDPERPTAVEAFEMVFAFDFRRYIEKAGFTGTGNMFVRKDVFDEVGPFRSGISEDIEWSLRAGRKGYRLGYAAGVVVRHPARRNWDQLRARWSRMLAEQHALACEQPFGRCKWAGAALLMPVSIIPHTWRLMRSDRLRHAKDRLGGTWVLAKLRIWRTKKMLNLLASGPAKESEDFPGVHHPASGRRSSGRNQPSSIV